jgi:hypothetical protein
VCLWVRTPAPSTGWCKQSKIALKNKGSQMGNTKKIYKEKEKDKQMKKEAYYGHRLM